MGKSMGKRYLIFSIISDLNFSLTKKAVFSMRGTVTLHE